ncbi:secondary thiamine-phosphate synthase enzyme YjbQ [uncultured Legionella sp.]|uniref:secondary thiamine-phosphate synthase enzyme YjbQ n=1 Tax=uncultured Legionella sp. TaxID=210934 RepID=UPI002638B943|nr:secondary thiamine-phosphate synthase enzyme YjbQ [uncultured Legionella sp.]
MISHKIIQLSPRSYGVHLITKDILNQVELTGSGILHLFIQHTSAALALNENASIDVLADVQQFFCNLVPEGAHYRHKDEGPDDMPAHIKSILCGASLSIPYQNGHLLLGIWQGIYLMEFRKKAGGRSIVLTQQS